MYPTLLKKAIVTKKVVFTLNIYMQCLSVY